MNAAQPTERAAQTAQAKHDWCVVFRTGGTENFEWHRSLAMSEAEAVSALERERVAGRLAYKVRYSQSVNIGLPTTFAGSKWELEEARKMETEKGGAK